MANDQSERLEIQICMVDGGQFDYFVEEQDEVARILQSIQSTRVFTQKQILLAGLYSMAGFQAEDITRLDLITSSPPEWPQSRGIRELQEVSEEILDRRALPRQHDMRREEAVARPGEVLETFAEFAMADGRRICLRMVTDADGAIDRRTQLTQFFSGPGFHLSRRGGGVSLINPRHILRWVLYPGPAEVPASAWRAHRLDRREWGGAPSMIFQKMDLTIPPASDEEQPKDPSD